MERTSGTPRTRASWQTKVLFPLLCDSKECAIPRPTMPDDPHDDTPPDEDVIVLPIEDHIDLHPFAPRDIPSVVEEYVWQCHEQGLREVRIIHGRGKGVQRRIVQSALEKNPLVESCRDAPAERGGWGATVAIIRLKETEEGMP